MRHKSLLLLVVLVFAPALYSQQKKNAVAAFGGQTSDERGSTRVLYWNQQKNVSAGQFAVDYGRPEWKKEYEDPIKFDGMTSGKVWRLGKDFWTVFDTNLPLRISGQEVAVGAYYLGLYRSSDGKQWSLAFIDPAKARAARTDGFEIGSAPIEFRIPVKLDNSAESAEKLTISFSYSKEKPKDVAMKIAWGRLNLVAPIQVSLAE
jgi:hypothetical protein